MRTPLVEKRSAALVFRAMCAVTAVLVAGSCGSEATVQSTSKGAPPAKTTPDGMLTGLSASYDLALLATGPDRFVLVDGGAGSTQDHTSTVIYELKPGHSSILARIDKPLRTPKAWVDADGSVVVVGMECADDGDLGPSCPNAPLEAVKLSEDGTSDTWPLGISTDASVGFAAGPTGQDGLAVVTLDPVGRKSHVAGAKSTGSRVVDLGVVDLRLPAATLVCRADNRTFLVPADLSSSGGAPVLFEIAAGSLQRAGQLEVKLSDVTTVSGCSNSGEVLVSSLRAGAIERSIMSLSDPGRGRPIDLSAPYKTGTVSLGHDGRLVAWTAAKRRTEPGDQDVWQLSENLGDSWSPVGQVTSTDPPAATALGPTSAAVVLSSASGSTVKILQNR